MSSNLRSKKQDNCEEKSSSSESQLRERKNRNVKQGTGILTRSRGQIRMSASSSGTDGQQGNLSTSRKRHSPSSGISRHELDTTAASAASSAVQNAASMKQRKVATLSNQASIDDGESSGGRELRYLTDFFPDQVENVRITRSKARTDAHSPSGQPGSPEGESSRLRRSSPNMPESDARNALQFLRGRRAARVTRGNQESSAPIALVNTSSTDASSSMDNTPNGVDDDARSKHRTRRAHKSANPSTASISVSSEHSVQSAQSALSDSRIDMAARYRSSTSSLNSDISNSLSFAAAWDPTMSIAAMDSRSAMLGYPQLQVHNMAHLPPMYNSAMALNLAHTQAQLQASSMRMSQQIPVIQQSIPSSVANQPSTSGGPIPFSLPGMLFDPLSGANPGGPPVPSSSQSRTASRTTSVASHFFHGLVPRMQHLLGHRSPQHDSRITNILDGMRSSAELRQNEAVLELGEMLLMANEDSIPAQFPAREITHLLIEHLQKEHNFELMLNSARCLRNLIEAIPRAQAIVLDAVPYLLEKLKRIECVDVAEQALSTLDDLSRRNAKTILTAGGIAACISHVDFFSIASQRLAYSIASNCAAYLNSADFHLIRDSLPDLTERLLIDDKRCLESVYQLFCRLVENLKSHSDKLKEIAGTNYRLLALVQQHLMSQPCPLSSNVFSNVLRMVRTLACRCPDVSAALIRMDYHSTIRTLFTGSTDEKKIEILERPPNQLQDMVLLIGELFPRLPTTGIFEIDAIISKSSSHGSAEALWYWQDEKNAFQAYKSSDSKMLELAQAHGQQYHDLTIGTYIYRIELNEMTQRNLSTGAVRTVRRVLNPNPRAKASEEDGRLSLLQLEPDLFERVLSSAFPILVSIDGSSSGAALRYDCLRVMLRMICPMSTSVLRKVLADLPLSGHIASALASPRSKDLSIVIAALEIAHILLEKLSDIYSPLFRKEGVAHEVQKLSAIKTENSKSAPCSGSTTPAQNDNPRMTRSLRRAAAAALVSPNAQQENTNSSGKPKEKDNRSRKRNSPDSSPATKKEKESRRKSSGLLSSLRIPGIGHRAGSSVSSPPSPPLPNAVTLMDASQEGPSSSSAGTPTTTDAPTSQLAVQGSLSSAIKEKYRTWIKKEAEVLLKAYLSDSGNSGSVIDTLIWVANNLQVKNSDVGTIALTQLHDILLKDSVSAFEMTHSGVITALHHYLVSEDETFQPPRKLRLKRFAAVFLCLTPDNLRPSAVNSCFEAFESLISKTLASVSQLEQFQVKVNDMGGVSTGTTNGCLRGAQALRFFQNHQIKCSLRRHPNCKDLREYQRNGGSTIKVDPFTSISSIERYLMDKGINRPKTAEDSSGEDMSDEEDAVHSTGSSTEEKRIEIVLGDSPLPSQMSVLQALRQHLPMSSMDTDEGMVTNMWMNTHVLFYRSAEKNNSDAQTNGSTAASVSSHLASNKKHKINEKLWIEGEMDTAASPLWSYLDLTLPRPVIDPSVPSLLLLRVLNGLNKFWFGLFDDEDVPPISFKPLLHSSVFHCPKLTAKLQRQLSDFISVATQQIPIWAIDLVKAVPFLFPFSLRRSVVYSTSFGRDRALMHLVSQSEGSQGEGEAGRLTPRLERKKIVVKRDDLMKSSESALANFASSRAVLEASFEGEAGTGFGPTLEFYSTLSREMQSIEHKMWHGDSQKESTEDGKLVEYTISGHGLYPSPLPHSQRRDQVRMKKFELLGRLMGQALVDCRMLDLPLSPVFLHWLVADPTQLGVPHMELLDPQMYSSLRNIALLDADSFDDLEQYFTMPGNEQFELVKGGRNKKVTKDTASKYVKLVSWWRLAEGVWREMEAVKRGFTQVVDPSHLSLFEPEELDQLFCGCSDGGEKVWGESVIAQAIKPDHGYTHDSEQVRWLVRMLASFSQEDQRKFVQFVTGSPRLPVGGFKALNPPLTVVKKTSSYGSGDEELPSAMTCYNYLKIPAYSSYEVFQERFSVALQFIYSFHLT